MKLILVVALALILGTVSSEMGFNASDWEFWFIVLIANAYYLVGHMRGEEG